MPKIKTRRSAAKRFEVTGSGKFKRRRQNLRHIRRFLEDGDRCKVTVFFRGREIVHKDRGESILAKIIADTADVGKCEQAPSAEGRTLQMMLVPLPKK